MGMGGIGVNSLSELMKKQYGVDIVNDADYKKYITDNPLTSNQLLAEKMAGYYSTLSPEKMAAVNQLIDPVAAKQSIELQITNGNLDPSAANDLRSRFNVAIPTLYTDIFGDRTATETSPTVATPSQPELPGTPPPSQPTIPPLVPTDQDPPTLNPTAPTLPQLLAGQNPTTAQPNLVQGQPVTELPVPVAANPDSILLPSNNPQLVAGQPGAPITQPTLDQQQIIQSASQQQADYINALNRANEINQNALAQYGQILSTQTPQLRGALEEALAKRKVGYGQLQNLLAEHENQQLGNLTPQVLEDLNSRGLLASTELGNSLARERSRLTAESANQLAQYGIGDIDLETQGLRDIASNQASNQEMLAGLGFGNQQDYASNSMGATNITNQAQQASLQRRFSLEDYQRELAAARELGAQIAPNIQPSGGTSPLTSALAGGGSGAMIGGSIGGPVGAGIGAGIGGLTGLFANKSKGK